MTSSQNLNTAFAFMKALHLNFIRLRPWENWSLEQLEEFLTSADEEGISVAVVLSHRYNSFIAGYPDDVQTSLQDLTALWDIFDRHPSVWGFDIRAEPFKKQLGYDENVELAWMQAIAQAIKQHDARYQVFTNLMESTPEKIPLVSPFSDYLAINYYFPRGGDLGGTYNGKEVPPEVYEQEMPGYIDAFMNQLRALNSENKPVLIAQFGAHHGFRADKPYTSARGQATWYRVFFETMKKHEDMVKGYFFFLLAAGDTGFPIIDANLQCKPACDEIKKAYGAYAEGGMKPDSLITSDFFGFDFWSSDVSFWRAVLEQMQQDSLQFGLIGTDALRWEAIEPQPPVNGAHNYDWSTVDAFMALVAETDFSLEVGVRTVSPWATVLPPEALVGAPCCNMSPLKNDADSDPAWGMTAAQAWYDFVYNFIERYDGDGVNDAPGVDRPVIRHLMYGNEPDTYDHFFANQGTVLEYQRALQILYQAAKAANPDVVVLRGKMNPGNAFDDNPDLGTVLEQRNEHGSVDSLLAFLNLGEGCYDVFAINFNDHYTGLSPLVQMLSQAMQQRGYTKPFVIADARTTLYPRDNRGPAHILPPRYPAGYLTTLDDPQHPDYLALKKLMQSDEARQSIRKIMVALETGQRAISLQPVYSQLNIDWARGDRKAMWLYSGFFDPYIFETTGDLARAREPLYYAMKQLIDALIGSHQLVERLALGGEFLYVYRLVKGERAFLIAWYENPWDVDEAGLVRRDQQMTVDLRGLLESDDVRVRRFVTQLDDDLMPVYPADEMVSAQQVILDETPVLIESARITSMKSEPTERPGSFLLRQNYPNPFNPATTIGFTLPTRARVTLKVFDLLGREVATLVDEERSAGQHAVVFDATGLPSGVYFYRITAGPFTQFRKAVLLR